MTSLTPATSVFGSSARALVDALPSPRFVLATADRWIVGSGVAERRSSASFEAVDEAWADGRLWFLRAPFDAQRAWEGLAGVRVWRPREALVMDARGVVHIDAAGRASEAAHRDREAAPDPHDRHDRHEDTDERAADAFVDDAADRSSFEDAVRIALAHIAAGAVSKLVIARRARLVLRARPAFDALVDALVQQFAAGSTVYAHESDDGNAFFGASPEQLLRRTQDAIEVDAVAGTRAVAEAHALLASEKDRREHRHVVDGIVAALAATSASTPSVSPVRVVERGGMAHLACTVSARASGPMSALLAALHPTAATAGTPADDATSMLRSIERFPRGDYGGLVGVLDRQTAVVAVALRAARVGPSDAFVYAGAGIVAGSDPAGEWRETMQKARVLLPAIARAMQG